jgi:predicted lipoprotein
MKRTIRWLPLVALLLAPVLQLGCKAYTVVKLNQDKSQGEGVKVYFENTKFNAEGYVAKIWDDKVMPFAQEHAKEATLVLEEYRKCQEGAGEKYGIRSSSEGIPWNFVIKGKGKVEKVETESRAGTLDVDLAPYDGTVDLKIQVGPVIKGAAIRDSLSFISFDEFENQIEFAKLANSMNKKACASALGTTEVSSMVGKEIEFVGFFTADGTEDVLVTPVEITIQ